MKTTQRGFSLVELIISLGIFLVVSGAVFQLLNAAQIRYKAEQEFMESFQNARLGVELIVRDVHNSGYPPPFTFAGNLGQPPTPLGYPAGTWTDPLLAPAAIQARFGMGILGVDAAGNVSTTCTVNPANMAASTCSRPSPWDLILEMDVDPENSVPTPSIEWVRYDLRGPAGDGTSTLYRTVNAKVVGGSPILNPSLVPFVEDIYSVPEQPGDIVQNPAQPLSATNIPVFSYECDPKEIIPGTTSCTAAHIKNVYVGLRVQSTRRDLQTRQFRRITVQGMGTRLNPSF